MSKSLRAKSKAYEPDFDEDKNPNLTSYGDTTYKIGDIVEQCILTP